MSNVADENSNADPRPVNAALCIDTEALDRFGPMLRHLLVGLVDQAVNVRLVSSDPRIETLSLGPVQTVIHERIAWPMASRRIERLRDVLATQPPTVVHAFSSASYTVAGALAESFDAALVLQVTSLDDCAAIARRTEANVGRFLALSQPLVTILSDQLAIPSNRILLVRPGILAAKTASCFTDPDRITTLLCPTTFKRDSGVDRVIEVVDRLRHRHDALMLFLLGQGNREQAVRRLIRARRLSRWITLTNLSGDLVQTMRSADIFVRTTTETAIAADGLQAMGSGMAVVACAAGVCDHLIDGETASLYDNETIDGLCGAIEKLLLDPLHARRIAEGGLEYVRAEHPVSAMAQQTADAYRHLAVARATLTLPE